MDDNTVCVRCKVKKSKTWWKCCPEHTPERSLAVVCDMCALILHPETNDVPPVSVEHRNVFDEIKDDSNELCFAQKPTGWGMRTNCTFKKGHPPPHSWVAY